MDDALVHGFEQAAIGGLAVELNDSANSAHSVCSESFANLVRL
jgi:hypothetical protein